MSFKFKLVLLIGILCFLVQPFDLMAENDGCWILKVTSDENIIEDSRPGFAVSADRNNFILDGNESRGWIRLIFDNPLLNTNSPKNVSLIVRISNLAYAGSNDGFLIYLGNTIIGRSGRVTQNMTVEVPLNISSLRSIGNLKLILRGAGNDGIYIRSKASGQGAALKLKTKTAGKIFSTNNNYGVSNGPGNATVFSIDRPYFISQIVNYHYNLGKGDEPGMISLKDRQGKVYGPWRAFNKNPDGTNPRRYWTVAPEIVLGPGSYTVIDSNPSTWAINSLSGQRGMTLISGWESDSKKVTPQKPNTKPIKGEDGYIASSPEGENKILKVTSDENIIEDSKPGFAVSADRNNFILDGNESRGWIRLVFDDPLLSTDRLKNASLIVRISNVANAGSNDGFIIYWGNTIIGRSGRVTQNMTVEVPLNISSLRSIGNLKLILRAAGNDGIYIKSKASGQGAALKLKTR